MCIILSFENMLKMWQMNFKIFQQMVMKPKNMIPKQKPYVVDGSVEQINLIFFSSSSSYIKYKKKSYTF